MHYITGFRPWLAFLVQRNYKFVEAEEGFRILCVIQMEIQNDLETTGSVGGSRILELEKSNLEGSRILREFGFTLSTFMRRITYDHSHTVATTLHLQLHFISNPRCPNDLVDGDCQI